MTPLTTPEVEDFQRAFQELRSHLSQVIKVTPPDPDGPPDHIDLVLYALFAGGHVLLEGLPGLGKTELVKTLGRLSNLCFRRIQFTPDLLPGDLLGAQVLASSPSGGPAALRFQPGPLFANLVLADEINRASPKVQSALLEAMGERQITFDGRTYPLDVDLSEGVNEGQAGRRGPFLVIATQNPIEMEGTFRLPEAQLDRFLFQVDVPYPPPHLLETILRETTGTDGPGSLSAPPLPSLGFAAIGRFMQQVRRVEQDERTLRMAARMVSLTQPVEAAGLKPLERVREAVACGSSPRGGQALILGGKVRALSRGRSHLSTDDLAAVAVPTLRHRLVLNHHGRRAARSDGRFLEMLIGEIVRASLA